MNEYSFENLEVYKAAREYRKKIYRLIRTLPKEVLESEKSISGSGSGW